jgi:hypothetical protein
MNANGEPMTLSRYRVMAFAGLLFLDFLLVLVMLATDKNLQSDFGVMTSVPPYFAHWYGLLAQGVLTLLAAVVVLVASMRISKGGRGLWSSRGLVLGALVFSLVALVADLAIVFTYAQVGFNNMSQFAQYLFGQTSYPGDVRYLYDVVLTFYALTVVAGALAVMRVRGPASGAAQP